MFLLVHFRHVVERYDKKSPHLMLSILHLNLSHIFSNILAHAKVAICWQMPSIKIFLSFPANNMFSDLPWISVVTNLFFERIRISNLIRNPENFRIRIRILFVVRKFSNPNPNIRDSGKKIRIRIRIWRNILIIQIIE